MAAANTLELALRRERAVLTAALAALVAIAALYTVLGVGMEMSALEATATASRPEMPGMAAMAMQPPQWTAAYFILVLLMWWVMMIAMMLPSAAPMILLHGALLRRKDPQRRTLGPSALFLVGYLATWAGFSLGATALQWLAGRGGWVSPAAMAVTGEALGGAILLAAGVYQFTRLKHACLDRCRNPVHFLSAHYRQGPLRTGLVHGAYCVGCCWMLMALLFFGGIMNLYWIAGLALVVLAEKLSPRGDIVGRALGAGLVLWGAGLVASAAGAI